MSSGIAHDARQGKDKDVPGIFSDGSVTLLRRHLRVLRQADDVGECLHEPLINRRLDGLLCHRASGCAKAVDQRGSQRFYGPAEHRVRQPDGRAFGGLRYITCAFVRFSSEQCRVHNLRRKLRDS